MDWCTEELWRENITLRFGEKFRNILFSVIDNIFSFEQKKSCHIKHCFDSSSMGEAHENHCEIVIFSSTFFQRAA